MAGLAGALDPALKVGDVLIDDLSDDFGIALQYRRVRMHTAEKIVQTPEDRRKLAQETGAAVVEMENAKVREFARRRKVPYLGIRAISDAADDVLDPAVIRFVDDVGQPKLGRLALEICRRPNLIPYLNRLRVKSTIAVDRLCDAMREMLGQLK